ncbi:hypothetical protein EUX98_g5781 [Antrodiella citrinella]|uniref:AAA+ ATPase domain-containing protein n=1 Tax=Antrodiella citrinella TaxID=2447956 RepID=A0A4S4MT95_9APHY|nr:hypothetical protein EUX98_g5781 [Antrodiella citrinella]
MSSLLLALGDAIEVEEEPSWSNAPTVLDELVNMVDGKDVEDERLVVEREFMQSPLVADSESKRPEFILVKNTEAPLVPVPIRELEVKGDSQMLPEETAELPRREFPLLENSEDGSPALELIAEPNVLGQDETKTSVTARPTTPSVEVNTAILRGEGSLLSPIEIRLAAPRAVPLESLESMSSTREDSIDSGERRFSTLSILSSPFGTPSSRVISPTFGPATSSGWPATTLFSSGPNGFEDERTDVAEHNSEAAAAFINDLDSPSDYQRRQSTSSLGSSKSVVIDVEDTVRPPLTSSLHDEGFDESLPFDENAAELAYVLDSDDTRHPHQAFTDAHVVTSPMTSVDLLHQSFPDDLGLASGQENILYTSATYHFPSAEIVAPLLAESTYHSHQAFTKTTDTIVTSPLDTKQVEADLTPRYVVDDDQPVHMTPPSAVVQPSNLLGVDRTLEAHDSTETPSSEPFALVDNHVVQAHSPLDDPSVFSQPISDVENTSPGEESYRASYIVGSSPDDDPDTSGELVSSNAPSPFTNVIEEDDTDGPDEPVSLAYSDPDESAPNIYDEYYSSIPISPAGSYASFAHAFHDEYPLTTSTPVSRAPTPSSSRTPVFSPPGQPSPYSSSVRNFSAPFKLDSSPSPHLSPGSASAISRPPSQLGSAKSHMKPLMSSSPVASQSPIETPSSATSTKMARAVAPPALTGLSHPSISNSAGSSHTRESALLSPALVRSASPRRLKPLRLSLILNSSSATLPSSSSAFPPSLTTANTASTRTPLSPAVSSDYSISNNILLMSPRSSSIPDLDTELAGQPRSAPAMDHCPSIPPTDAITRRQSWQHRVSRDFDSKQSSSRRSSLANIPPYIRPSSSLSEQLVSLSEEEEVDFAPQYDDYVAADEMDDTIRGDALLSSRPPSVMRSPVHAIATPRPTLLFAIASDDISEVRRVLESGESGPNDDVGPQSALAFAVTTTQLKHKQDIIKLLLAHGANPSGLLNALRSRATSRSVSPSESQPGGKTPAEPALLENLDPATRYFISRAEAPQTRRASALIHRSFFRPLTKVRYDMIGQDRALEQLFRVLSMPSAAPIVVLLCGPSGHGKSLLARRFGSLLDVPTHTVNMTTLSSTHDIWRSYSMSPFEEPSSSTLGDFLTEHQRKRCVVVLDEIEKVEDEKYLSSLLMPWELGRCSFGAGQRHVDVSKVIWLGTSNIGHDLVFEHQAQRVAPEAPMTREEYVDLMGMLRPQVSDRLGPSLLSRVTTVLPFVSFSDEEKMAIAAEALHSLTGEGPALPAATVEKLVKDSLQEYVPAEGARSLYRAVSNLLLDTIH